MVHRQGEERMNTKISFRSHISLLVLLSCLLSGCQFPFDPNNMNTTETGVVDFTSYSGLSIRGELGINEEEPIIGPLDLGMLSVALFTKCHDEYINDLNDASNDGQICIGDVLTEDASPVDKCRSLFCLSQMYNCLGQKFMEVGDSVGIYTLDTEIFEYSASMDAGVVYFKLDWNDLGVLYKRIGTGQGAYVFHYRIPPLSAANKTLVLRAAHRAFAMAGAHGAHAADLSNCVNGELVVKSGTESPTLLDYYVHGFAESVQMFSEATKTLVLNEDSVASGVLSKNTDYAEAQQQKWGGLVNSHGAALKHIVGYSGGPVPQGCCTKLNRASHKKALDFLRRASVPDILNLNVSDSDVVNSSWNAIYSDIHKELPSSVEVDSVLRKRDMNLSDIAMARRYLIDEQSALKRNTTVFNDGFQDRIHGLKKGAMTHSGAYWLGLAAGGPGATLDGTTFAEPNGNYARQSAVATLDYMRHGANKVLKLYHDGAFTDMSADQADVLGKTSIAAGRLAGNQRIEAIITNNITSVNMQLRVYGVKEGDKILLIEGDKGYRCMLEGSNDGAPCNASDLNILDTNTIVQGPSTGSVSLMDRYIEFPDIPTETDRTVYIFGFEGGSPILYGSVSTDVVAGDTVRKMFPYGTTSLTSDVPKIAGTKMSEDDCGEPENICAELDVPSKFVPPLETELTEDSNPYENSWKHYLDLAKQAAEEADRLGEQLVDSGLAMDVRSEQARQKLEEICGGVVTTPDAEQGTCGGDYDPTIENQHKVCDPALAQCLPSSMGGTMKKIPFVSLGRSSCFYKWKKSGRLCACSYDEANPDPPDSKKCLQACPITASETVDCTTLYTNALEMNKWTAEDGGVEFIKIDENNSLNVFMSSDVQGVVNCSLLRDLEQGIYDGVSYEQMNKIYRSILMQDQDWWLNSRYLGNLASSLRFDTDMLYHYTISLGGRTLWTTKVTDADMCPEMNLAFLNEGGKVECYHPRQPGQSMNDWLEEELSTGGAAQKRYSWAQTALLYIMNLKSITNTIGNITTSVIKNPWDYSIQWKGVGYEWIGDEKTGFPVKEGYPINSVAGYTGPWQTLAEGLLSCNYEDWSGTKLYENPNALYNGGLGRVDCELEKKSNGSYYWFLDEANTGIVKFLASGTDGKDVTEQMQILSHLDLYDGFFAKFWWNMGGECIRAFYKNPPVFGLTPLRTVHSLMMACNIIDRWGGGYECDDYDPNSLPQLQNESDILDLDKYVKCAAQSIHSKAQLLILANFPEIIKDGYQRNGIEGYYPGYQGKNLEAILAIEADIRKFGNIVDNIRDTLFQVSESIKRIYLNREHFDMQLRIIELESMRNVVGLVIQGIQTLMQTQINTRSLVCTGLMEANIALGIFFEEEIAQTKEDALLVSEDIYLSTALSEIATRLTEIRQAAGEVASTYSSIQNNLSRLDRLENEASEAWATMNFLDSDVSGRVLPVNTVMRRRNNTIRIRYQKALIRAKKLAYIARRAIEFRLGIDMTQMTDTMTLVPPPKEWADRICELQGFDYTKIKEANPDDPLVNPYEAEENETDNYAHMYVGDYVKLLSDFVESYNIDYRFTDESDTAVLSLKDDIDRTKEKCEIESYNLLYYSQGMDKTEKWRREGCGTVNQEDTKCLDVIAPDLESGNTCDEVFCFGEKYDNFDKTRGTATRIMDLEYKEWTIDATNYKNRPDEYINSGYFAQTIENADSGFYILNWYSRLPEGSDAAEYRVEVWQNGDGTEMVPIEGGYGIYTLSDSEWKREIQRFKLSEPKTIEVRIYPSNLDEQATLQNPENVVKGDMWIWGLQLELVDPWRCRNDPELCLVEPLEYQMTEESRKITGEYCPDLKGTSFRGKFERKCICENNFHSECKPEDVLANNKQCYRQFSFTLSLEDIEKGKLIPSNNIAIGNFNYRLEDIAVNLVGTNIRICGANSGTCSANAFIPYTIAQNGIVRIKNNVYDKVEVFEMPVARIEHGKALAAEVLVTNPPTSTHNQLLAPYMKTGLRGRPLQGTYVLRIWETPELNWDAIEDVQLIWKYRYWTRSDYE